MENSAKNAGGACIPGKKINELMEAWEQEVLGLRTSKMSPALAMTDPHELWKSLEQFEEELRKGKKGTDIYLEQMQARFVRNTDAIKDKAAFRIEALETALNKTKIALKMERERMTMLEQEEFSRLANNYKPVREMEGLIKQCDERLVLKNTAQARIIIKDLTAMLKKDVQNVVAYERNVADLKIEVEKRGKAVNRMKKQLEESHRVRFYYQSIVMKYARDVDLFNDNQGQLDKFVSIDESNEDFEDQQDYVILLKELGLDQQIVDSVNKYDGIQKGLNEVSDFCMKAENLKVTLPEDFVQDYVDSIITLLSSKKREAKNMLAKMRPPEVDLTRHILQLQASLFTVIERAFAGKSVDEPKCTL